MSANPWERAPCRRGTPCRPCCRVRPIGGTGGVSSRQRGDTAGMETFGHYTILERLRTGALGELSRARDARLGRTVALRLVVAGGGCRSRPPRRPAVGRVGRQRRCRTLTSPRLFDFGEENGRRLPRARVRSRSAAPGAADGTSRSTPTLALEFAVQLADAVAEGHRHGVVHGDIRPSSIFITPTDQTKIVGFGLSRWSTGGIERATIAARTGRRQRTLDAQRRDDRALPVAGAGARRARGRAVRRLLARRRHLRDADGAGAVRVRHARAAPR